jgi:hypothetical protein
VLAVAGGAEGHTGSLATGASDVKDSCKGVLETLTSGQAAAVLGPVL